MAVNLTKDLLIKFDGNVVGAVQKVGIFYKNEKKYMEFEKIFFDYDTSFLRILKNPDKAHEICIEYMYDDKSVALSMKFKVELEEYEQVLTGEEYITVEKMRFKIIIYNDFRFDKSGKEIKNTKDEDFNSTLKRVFGRTTNPDVTIPYPESPGFQSGEHVSEVIEKKTY